MGIAALARFSASLAAVFAAGTGVCALVAAADRLFSLASLDLSDTRHWRHVVLYGAFGFTLVGYAAGHVTFCRRPTDGRAIAVRAIFTAAGGTVAVLIMHSALNASPYPGCGMKWFADFAPFLFAAGFVVVEIAAWSGWVLRHRRQMDDVSRKELDSQIGSEHLSSSSRTER
jgi:hypothetical protein